MIKQIATVAVYVENQQKAKTFWSEKVGFDVIANHPMGPNAFWLEVAPKGAESRLVIYPKSMMQGSENMKASIIFNRCAVSEGLRSFKDNLHHLLNIQH